MPAIDRNYWYSDDFYSHFDNDQITVKYDCGDGEETFVLSKVGEGDYCYYGAPSIDDYTIDFTEYPIKIEVGSETICFYASKDVQSYTIEILGETAGTPAIWDKVGGGGSGPDPSSDGDLIILRTYFSSSGTRLMSSEYEDVSMSASEIAEAVNNNKNVVIIIDDAEVAYFDHMESSIGTRSSESRAYFASILMDTGTGYYVDESNHFIYEGGPIGPYEPGVPTIS